MITGPDKERFEKLREERRMVRVPVDVRIFGDLLTQGLDYTLTAEGLPKDAIFLTVERDPMMQALGFIYLHESFKPVPEGEYSPIVNVMLTRHQNAQS